MQDEKKFILLDILEQEYTDDNTGLKKPYYDIFIKDVAQMRVMKLRAYDNTAFSQKLADYMYLVGKEVRPVFSQKQNKSGIWVSVVEDILA